MSESVSPFNDWVDEVIYKGKEKGKGFQRQNLDIVRKPKWPMRAFKVSPNSDCLINLK
jgi:hypothetical protein